MKLSSVPESTRAKRGRASEEEPSEPWMEKRMELDGEELVGLTCRCSSIAGEPSLLGVWGHGQWNDPLTTIQTLPQWHVPESLFGSQASLIKLHRCLGGGLWGTEYPEGCVATWWTVGWVKKQEIKDWDVLSLLRSMSQLSNLTAKEISESWEAVSFISANLAFNWSLNPLINTLRKAESFYPEWLPHCGSHFNVSSWLAASWDWTECSKMFFFSSLKK